MRAAILMVLIGLLVFGCAGGGTQSPPTSSPSTSGPAMPGNTQACTPAYTFTDLSSGQLGNTTKLGATVTCADGITLAVSEDGQNVKTVTVSGNDTQPVTLDFPAIKDGSNINVTVDASGQTVFSRSWSVSPLGDSETGGTGYDPVTIKEWRAMSVNVVNQITPNRVRIFAQRQDYSIQPDTTIEVDIASDSGGNPGTVLASSTLPVNATALNDLWLNFDFANPPTLSPGTYWIIMKVDRPQNSGLAFDVVNWHYTTVDQGSKGNSYTRQMELNEDVNSGAVSQTQWTPLSYDRIYTAVLTTQNS